MNICCSRFEKLLVWGVRKWLFPKVHLVCAETKWFLCCMVGAAGILYNTQTSVDDYAAENSGFCTLYFAKDICFVKPRSQNKSSCGIISCTYVQSHCFR